MTQPVAVIIPAHDEAAVIEGTLRTLLADAPVPFPGRVIVVPNGCRDDTAARARAVGAPVEVLERPQGGKAAAINAALAQVPEGWPVVICDADIPVPFAMIEAVHRALAGPGVAGASPAARLVFDDASWPVRAFCRVKAAGGYLASGMGGSGIYALSPEGRRLVGTLPAIIADDNFARRSIPAEAQRRVSGAATEVKAPRTLWALISTEARKYAGDRELARVLAAMPGQDRGGGAMPRARRASGIDGAVHAAIKLAARALYGWRRVRGRAGGWYRDDTRR